MATVLVLDDESSIRDLLDTVLSRKGYQVLRADTALKAVDLFRRERPDIAILDLMMPGMNGMTVLEQIRSQNADIPIIILTGLDNEETEAKARSLGVTDFLKKSFSLDQLGRALKKAGEQITVNKSMS